MNTYTTSVINTDIEDKVQCTLMLSNTPGIYVIVTQFYHYNTVGISEIHIIF